MPKIKQPDFAGQTIFCGIDVHKNSWRVNVRDDQFELENYSQDPSEELLLKHLHKRYPGANFQVAYEAGFSRRLLIEVYLNRCITDENVMKMKS